jgi:hypothetical protein
MATTSTSTTSAINFDLKKLAGNNLLRLRLCGYFSHGDTATLHVYYTIGEHEVPFLIEIGEGYISVFDWWCNEDVMRMSISGQKSVDFSKPGPLSEKYEKLESQVSKIESVIGTAIEQYLNILEDAGLFNPEND